VWILSKRKQGKMDEITKVNRLYNSTIEVAVRVILILEHSKNHLCSKEKLLALDHFSLNTFDVGGPASLHAPIPNRGVQILAKKPILDKALIFLMSKDLIICEATDNGFFYRASQNATLYLNYFETEYFIRLKSRINWVTTKFSKYSEKDLSDFVKTNIDNWGEEIMPLENSYI
jgi:hypothetical protein